MHDKRAQRLLNSEISCILHTSTCHPLPLQDAVMRLGGSLHSCRVVANPATLQRHAQLHAGLEATGARLLQANCRWTAFQFPLAAQRLQSRLASKVRQLSS